MQNMTLFEAYEYSLGLIPFMGFMERTKRTKASVFMVMLHAGQKRKYTNDNFCNHPAEVSNILDNLGVEDEDILAAAALHDTIEDCGVNAVFLEHHFGKKVAKLVSEVTGPSMSFPKASRKDRKAMDREWYAQASDAGIAIKIADIISNCRTIADDDPKFAVTYLAEKDALLSDFKAKIAFEHAETELPLLTLYVQAREIVNDGLTKLGMTIPAEDTLEAQAA